MLIASGLANRVMAALPRIFISDQDDSVCQEQDFKSWDMMDDGASEVNCKYGANCSTSCIASLNNKDISHREFARLNLQPARYPTLE
jgi:hypothetical protein